MYDLTTEIVKLVKRYERKYPSTLCVFSYPATFGSLNGYCKHFRFRTHFTASSNCITFCALIFLFSLAVVLPFYSINYVCVYVEYHTYHDCQPTHSAPETESIGPRMYIYIFFWIPYWPRMLINILWHPLGANQYGGP